MLDIGFGRIVLLCSYLNKGITFRNYGKDENTLKDVAKLLNEMLEKSIISNYAIFGAVAQMRYTEAVMTMDMDVLVALPQDTGFNLLSDIYSFCKSRSYLPEGDAIRVADWPVQFIPAFSSLTEDAMLNAEVVEFDDISIRVVTPVYLAVIALSVGRAKDYARILALIEEGVVTKDQIENLSLNYDLVNAWKIFKRRFDDD